MSAQDSPTVGCEEPVFQQTVKRSLSPIPETGRLYSYLLLRIFWFRAIPFTS